MNRYSHWLAELTTLNQQLLSLTGQQNWQALEITLTNYRQLAAAAPDCTAAERQHSQAEYHQLLEAHRNLSLQINQALQQTRENLSHGRQQQQLLQAYFSV